MWKDFRVRGGSEKPLQRVGAGTGDERVDVAGVFPRGRGKLALRRHEKLRVDGAGGEVLDARGVEVKPTAVAFKADLEHIAAGDAHGAAVFLFQFSERKIEVARHGQRGAGELRLNAGEGERMADVLGVGVGQIVDGEGGEVASGGRGRT